MGVVKLLHLKIFSHVFHGVIVVGLFNVLFLFHGSDLRSSRARLLELFTDLNCNPEMMKNAADSYFSILQG